MTATPSELPGLPEEPKPVAWIEHHKAGDNVGWERVDHPYAKATPLYSGKDYDALRSRLVEQGEEIERLKRDRDAIVDETNW
jgi:hypothetical protein